MSPDLTRLIELYREMEEARREAAENRRGATYLEFKRKQDLFCYESEQVARAAMQ